MVRLNFSFNIFQELPGSQNRQSYQFVSIFLFLNKHQVQGQVFGRSLGTFMHIHSRSPTTHAQHRTNQNAKSQDKSELVLGSGTSGLADQHQLRSSSSRRFAHSNPHSPQTMSLNGSHCLIIKIKLKRYPLVLCFSMIDLHTFYSSLNLSL